MALILVLWILIILNATAIGFATFIRLQMKIVENQKERLVAYYIAKAGIDRAILEIKKDNNDYDSLDEKWSTNEEAYESVPFGEGEYSVKVIDEERKLNINLPLKDEKDERIFRSMLSCLPMIEEEQVEAILKYRRENIFKSVDEIFLLEGMNKEIFLAIREFITVYSFEREDKTKININKATKEELKTKLGITYKEADDIINNRPYRSLTDLFRLEWMNKDRFIQIIDRITTKEAEIITGRININTASEEVLEALGFDPDTARSIIEERKRVPFQSISSILSFSRLDLEKLIELNLDLMSFSSHTFTIESTATYNGTIVKIRAVIRRNPTQPDTRPRISILYYKEVT